MPDNKLKKTESEKDKKSEKTAGNNQWTETHLKDKPDKRERRDGPGGN